MKTLILLLILLSFIVGVPTNLGWFSLFSSEFLAPISMVKGGTISAERVLAWIILITAHSSVLSLFFLTQKPFFPTVLFCFPILFILIFILFDPLSAIFLVPFIIVWIIALVKQSIKRKKSSLVLKVTE